MIINWFRRNVYGDWYAHIRPRSEMIIRMRLYVTCGAPNSIIAVDNLNAIIKDLADRCKLEIVDILKDPLRAIDDGIFITPPC